MVSLAVRLRVALCVFSTGIFIFYPSPFYNSGPTLNRKAAKIKMLSFIARLPLAVQQLAFTAIYPRRFCTFILIINFSKQSSFSRGFTMSPEISGNSEPPGEMMKRFPAKRKRDSANIFHFNLRSKILTLPAYIFARNQAETH